MNVRHGFAAFVLGMLVCLFLLFAQACGRSVDDIGSDCAPDVLPECCACPSPEACEDGVRSVPKYCADGGVEGGAS